jgi:hypothetical protein
MPQVCNYCTIPKHPVTGQDTSEERPADGNRSSKVTVIERPEAGWQSFVEQVGQQSGSDHRC